MRILRNRKYNSIYNQLGQLVYLHTENQQQGEHQLQWDALDMAEGLYYYRLKADGRITAGKLVKKK